MKYTFSFKFKKNPTIKAAKMPLFVLLIGLLGAHIPMAPHAEVASIAYGKRTVGHTLRDIQRDLRKLTPAQAYQIDIMARTIYGEGRGEQSLRSLEAIAHVIMNRTKDSNKRWPTHIVGVVKQKLQFSCWNSNDPNIQTIKKVTLRDSNFRRCYRAALNAMYAKDVIRGANHYHTIDVSPEWTKNKNMVRVARIGKHIFYKA